MYKYMESKLYIFKYEHLKLPKHAKIGFFGAHIWSAWQIGKLTLDLDLELFKTLVYILKSLKTKNAFLILF